MSKTAFWMAVVLIGVGVAQVVQKQLSLMINGQPSGAKALVVNGQNYVPVSALKDLGITVSLSGSTLSLSGAAAGGANQRVSLEACVNEFAFNGIWRMRVTKVEPSEAFGQKAWVVTVELRNGTNRTLEPGQTGIMDSSGLSLAFPDGSTTGINASALAREYETELRGKAIPQGGSVLYPIKFDTPKPDAPTKLLVQIDPARLQSNLGVGYTTPNPSFRFNLNCSK